LPLYIRSSLTAGNKGYDSAIFLTPNVTHPKILLALNFWGGGLQFRMKVTVSANFIDRFFRAYWNLPTL
jgi:hypothetical protein